MNKHDYVVMVHKEGKVDRPATWLENSYWNIKYKIQSLFCKHDYRKLMPNLSVCLKCGHSIKE